MIAENSTKKTGLEDRIRDLKADSGIDERRRKNAEVDTLILEEKNEFNKAKQEKLSEIQGRGNTLRTEETGYQNEITKINGLDSLTNLLWVELNENKISKIMCLDNLTKLIKLKIEKNQIVEIEGLDNLKHLKQLF